MSIVDEKMTALADEVRELSGTTGKLGIDDMTNSVGEANADVVSQTDLISQIKSAVNNLPEAGSGGNTDNLKMFMYDELGNLKTVTFIDGTSWGAFINSSLNIFYYDRDPGATAPMFTINEGYVYNIDNFEIRNYTGDGTMGEQVKDSDLIISGKCYEA